MAAAEERWVTVSALQFACTDDVDANVDRAEKYVLPQYDDANLEFLSDLKLKMGVRQAGQGSSQQGCQYRTHPGEFGTFGNRPLHMESLKSW